MAEALKHTHDLDLVYRVVARGLRDTLPGGAVAGVCRLRPRGADDPGGLEVVAGEPSLVEVVEVENTTGRGPCRDAVAGHGVIDVPQLAEGAPWPEVATEAGQRGWRSVLVCPFVERTDKHRGALVVYSRSANGVGRSGREAVEHLAELAGVSLSGARRIADLLDALQSRDVIGQAKGMLMLRDGLDAEQAFARLVEASQHANIKLRDVAAWLVEAAVVRGDR